MGCSGQDICLARVCQERLLHEDRWILRAVSGERIKEPAGFQTRLEESDRASEVSSRQRELGQIRACWAGRHSRGKWEFTESQYRRGWKGPLWII